MKLSDFMLLFASRLWLSAFHGLQKCVVEKVWQHSSNILFLQSKGFARSIQLLRPTVQF